MKVTKIYVQTYRSIVDSGTIEIEEGVTVLIGKNEQGKTNFLRAIRAFNSEEQFTPGDLPNHLRPSLEDSKAQEIPIISIWFALDPNDKKKLAGVVHDVESVSEIKCTKHYGNNYKYWQIKDGEENLLKFAPPDIAVPVGKVKATVANLKSKLQIHTTRIPPFAANAEKIDQITSGLLDANLLDPAQLEDAIKTFSTAIKGLTGQDQPVLDDITTAITELDAARSLIQASNQQDPEKIFRQLLPYFILHSTKTDNIPNEVKVVDFVKDSDATSKGMSNLCRTAGLTIQKIRELAATTDTAQREAYEDHYKGTISGGLNEFWTQAEYHVHFRIDKDQLSVSISDGKYTQRVPPSDRSDGFQWYLSFYSTLLNDVGVSNQTVLLLDNPGLELHVDGQRDIKRFLEEKVSLNSQVLYVTHSPAMIDPFNLHQVRAVELLGDQQGTKVKNFALKQGDNSDLLEPVRSAIGMSLVASLILNEWNILVEGAADKPIVEGMFLFPLPGIAAEAARKREPSGKQRRVPSQILREGGPSVRRLIGRDAGGRELREMLTAAGIPEQKIISLNEVFRDMANDFAIEDIVSANFYHQAVVSAYPANPVEQPQPGNKKRSTLYVEAFRAVHNIGFSKRRVAESVKKLLSEKREDQETRDRLGTLSTAIIQKLKEQASQTGDVDASPGRVA